MKKTKNREAVADIKGARVLLAEDNEINQQVAKEILEGAGLNVSMANDGQEAVSAVQENQYDAVLMDIQMPVMDGHEATRRFEPMTRFKDLPIIAMTAHAMAGDHEKCLEAGMNDHVTKPIDTEALYETLSRWIKSVGGSPIEERIVQASVSPKMFVEDVQTPTKLDGINVEAGLKRVLGKWDTYQRILLSFLKDLEGVDASIRNLVSEKKTDEAQRLVHSIKGAGGNLGAEELQAAADPVETWFKNGQQELPQPEYDHFVKALHRVIKAIAGLRREEPSPVHEKNDLEPMPAALAKETAQRVREAVEVGDVAALSELASELKARGEAGSYCGEEIVLLADGFDFDGLMKLANNLDGEDIPEG